MKCIAALLMAHSLLAQQSVPVVDCPFGGQEGQENPPMPKSRILKTSHEMASRLASYELGGGPRVLAPRGWHCFGTRGSGGEDLLVSPRQPKFEDLVAHLWSGPSIEIIHRYGGTAGRFSVAEIIARVFPAYRGFSVRVQKEFPGTDHFVFHPYPKDALTYTGDSIVDFETPPETEGLGTWGTFKPDSLPIKGAALLFGPEHDLLFVSVRLQSPQSDLAQTIIEEAKRSPQKY